MSYMHMAFAFSTLPCGGKKNYIDSHKKWYKYKNENELYTYCVF